MFWKVLVLEIKDKYCLAMREDGSVVRIIKKPNIKEGDTIYVVEDDLYTENSKKVYKIKRSTVQKLTAVVAAVAVFAVVMTIPQFADKACAIVSFDGEKSVELKLNKNNEIIDAKSYDDTLTEDELDKLEGMNLFDASDNLKSFDSKDGALLVASASMKNSQKDSELEDEIEEMLEDCDSIYLKGDKDDIEKAEKAKKSLGIYLIEKAIDNDEIDEIYDEVSPEELDKFIKKYGNRISAKKKAALSKYKATELNDDDDLDDDSDDDDKYEKKKNYYGNKKEDVDDDDDSKDKISSDKEDPDDDEEIKDKDKDKQEADNEDDEAENDEAEDEDD